MSEKRPQTEEPADPPEELQQSDAERAAEIADAKEKSGEETVV